MRNFWNVVIGCFISCIGILFLRHSHLVTGGAPGLALGMSYLTGVPFSVMFIVVNLPFYILSIMRMGWNFTLSTLLAAITLSFMTEIDRGLPDLVIPDYVGAVVGGGIVGFGLSFLFWNGASLGGVNILVLYLNRRFGWDPGKTTFVVDFIVVLSGVYTVGVAKGLYSLLSVVILSSIISFFKGRISRRNKAPATGDQLPDKTALNN